MGPLRENTQQTLASSWPSPVLHEVCFITQERGVFRETERKDDFHIQGESYRAEGAPEKLQKLRSEEVEPQGPGGGGAEKLLSEFVRREG